MSQYFKVTMLDYKINKVKLIQYTPTIHKSIFHIWTGKQWAISFEWYNLSELIAETGYNKHYHSSYTSELITEEECMVQQSMMELIG